MTEPVLSKEFLAHFGVKGMKWGVRRAEKKQAHKNATNFANEMSQRAHVKVQGISEAQYKRLSNKPIPLGSDFKRVSTTGGKLEHLVYVSKTADDHTRYKAVLTSAPMNRNVKNYDVSIKTSKNLVSPSDKERVDTFIDLMDRDISYGDQTFKGRAFVEGALAQSHGVKYAKALSNRELGLKMFHKFAQEQYMDAPLQSAYFKSLRDKGHAALVDDNDKGVYSDIPIILFPKESGARVTEVKLLSDDDIRQAQLNLKPLD